MTDDDPPVLRVTEQKNGSLPMATNGSRRRFSEDVAGPPVLQVTTLKSNSNRYSRAQSESVLTPTSRHRKQQKKDSTTPTILEEEGENDDDDAASRIKKTRKKKSMAPKYPVDPTSLDTQRRSLRRRRNSDYSLPKIVTTKPQATAADNEVPPPSDTRRRSFFHRGSLFSSSVELKSTDSYRRETINDASIVGPGFVDLPECFLRSPTARILQPNEDLRADDRSSTDDRSTTSGGRGSTDKPAASRGKQDKPILLDRLFGDNRKDLGPGIHIAPLEPAKKLETRRKVRARQRVDESGVLAQQKQAPQDQQQQQPPEGLVTPSTASPTAASPQSNTTDDDGLTTRLRARLSRAVDVPKKSASAFRLHHRHHPKKVEGEKASLTFRVFNALGLLHSDPRMGNTSLANCCTQRPETHAKSLAKNPPDSPNSKLNDLELFDEAYSNNDVRGLIKLISSQESLGTNVGENLHPWAAPPRTVGSLSITQLAALAASEDMAVKERLRSSNVIPVLVKQLGSQHEDRADAALVALSFLSIDFPKACIEMFEQQIFPPLIGLLKRPKNGVKAAAAQTARNIYVLEVRYRRAFRDAGGCQPLVDLLDMPKGEYDADTLDLQIEAVYHIDDFIMFNGEEVSDCIAAVKVCNVAWKLEALQEVKGNNGLRTSARQLYLRVAE